MKLYLSLPLLLICLSGCFSIINNAQLAIPNGSISVTVINEDNTPVTGANVTTQSFRDNEPFGFGMNGNYSKKIISTKSNTRGSCQIKFF